MPEIFVRFANKAHEFLQTLTPVVFGMDPTSALVFKEDASKVDYPWIKNYVLNTFETIFTENGLQDLVCYLYDSPTGDNYANYVIQYIPDTTGGHKSGNLALTTGVDTSRLPLPKELENVFMAITAALTDELPDIAIRSLSSSAVSKTIASMSKAVGATPTGSTTPDIDKLCEELSKTTKAEIVKPKETLKDYICNDLLKEELTEIKDFFEKSMDYKSKNVEIPKGILFKGPPGTGKTYAARCIAGSTDCFFMSCTASALQGMYIGSGAENIRQLFKGAKLLAKKTKKGVIIFVDEFDSLGSRLNHGGGAGSEEDRTLNQFLAEMSGFSDCEEQIMVIAATNYSERLDDALLRSGRFGRQITIGYPDDLERRELVKYYFNKIAIPLDTATSHDEIADLAKGLTPADIKEIANESGILTIRKKVASILLDNVNEAVNKVITKNIRHPDPKDAEVHKLVTAHECGHVLAEVIYNNTIPIKVTNFPYGDAGGFTQSAEVLAGILSKNRYINEIKKLLAGRAAEEVVCGYITNGASNDLMKAKTILTNYFKIYNFEKYPVEDLEQTVVDRLDTIYLSVVKDFKDPKNRVILDDLIRKLDKERVLYAKDISTIVSPIRGSIL